MIIILAASVIVLLILLFSPNICITLHKQHFEEFYKDKEITKGIKIYKNRTDKYKGFVIVETPKSKFIPKHNNKGYPFITSAGSANFHNSPCQFNTFNSKELALSYLDQWLDCKGTIERIHNI